jgi:hypothetical protein
MNQTRLDLYTDYLTVTFGYATATGLSQLLDGGVCQDSCRFVFHKSLSLCLS